MRTVAALVIALMVRADLCTASAASPDEVMPSRPVEVLRLLRARDFATVTRAIEVKQATLERDIRRESELARLVETFETADPDMAPLIEDWMRAAPGSFAPRLAYAVHHVALAWNRRGASERDKTTAEQSERMQPFLRAAVDAAHSVIAANARVGEAYRVLISAAMAAGDQESCARATTQGLKELPASFRVRTAQAMCLLPRWGGSYEAIEELANAADAYLRQNAQLGALHGFVSWDRGNLAASGTREEMDWYNRALSAGEFWPFYRDRARAHLEHRRHTQALADVTRALHFSPDDPATLIVQTRILSALNRHTEARQSVRLVEEIEPTSRHLAAFRQRELADGAKAGRVLFEAGDVRAAVARLTRTIDLTGGDEDVYYLRGRAHRQLGDRASALLDFQDVIRLNPRQFDAYLNVDQILTSARNWDRIISYWTDYLALDPYEARAYYARAAAKYRKGVAASAMADVKKACELGGTVGCSQARGSTSR